MRPLGSQSMKPYLLSCGTHPLATYAAPASWEPVLACSSARPCLVGQGAWQRKGHIVLPGPPPPSLLYATPLPDRELLLLQGEGTDFHLLLRTFPRPLAECPFPLLKSSFSSSAEVHGNISVLQEGRLLVLQDSGLNRKGSLLFS